MKMHFSKEHVARLIEHTKAAPEHRALYGIGKAEVGLWLVGDTGIYLMSNGRPEMEIGGGRLDVCYAAECDPNTNADFWDVKCRAFGWDDWTVFIPLDAVESVLRICQKSLVIDLTPRSYQLLADR